MPLVNAERWQECWEEDMIVLNSLRSNGDAPEVVRPIDVSFRGSASDLKRLSACCNNFGFTVLSFDEADENGNPWLFLVRDQTTDDNTMREMTTTYLQIEDVFGVRCDGWGCLAHNRKGPISLENPA